MLYASITNLILAVYWADRRIHTLGNIGFKGSLHAGIAPAFTKLIDHVAYGSVDIRKNIHDILNDYENIVDLGCGTGLSTPYNNNAIGVDISHEMLYVAKTINTKASFTYGNIESWGKTAMTDAVLVSFVFHEVPQKGRKRILENAFRLSRKAVFIIDISPEYIPQASMLLGEPFIKEYLTNIQTDLEIYGLKCVHIIPKHVCLWSCII